MRVVIEFNSPATEPPNDSPAMTMSELAQLLRTESSEKSRLRRVSDEVLRLLRQLPGNHLEEWLQLARKLSVHFFSLHL